MLRTMTVKQMFPPGSDAEVAKFGTLDCHANECEMIFELEPDFRIAGRLALGAVAA